MTSSERTPAVGPPAASGDGRPPPVRYSHRALEQLTYGLGRGQLRDRYGVKGNCPVWRSATLFVVVGRRFAGRRPRVKPTVALCMKKRATRRAVWFSSPQRARHFHRLREEPDGQQR